MTTRTREAVMTALFTQLKTAGTVFQTYSRRWLSWIDDPMQKSPSLPLLVQWESPIAEDYNWGNRGIGPTRTWDIRLLAYGKIPVGDTPGTPDGTTPGAAVLNPLIDAIETALSPPSDSDGVLTLGGLVLDCRIEGQIVKATGDADPSGICGAIIPVRILVQ